MPILVFTGSEGRGLTVRYLPLLLLSSVAFAQTEIRVGDAALTPGEEQRWRAEIRRTLFVPDPLPDLNRETHGQFEPAAGVIAERVTYGTQFGLRIPAILYLPKSRGGRVPGLIIVNGHGGDKYSWYAFYSGILFAKAGAAVLTYDPAGEGERNIDRESGTRAHDKVEPPEELARRLGGLMMTDVMQAVSYLAHRKEVDPGRIAAAGYSMGSFVLSLTCAVEQRLKACVLVGGGNLDGPGGYWDRSKPMCQGTPYQSLSFLGDRPAAIYALHASRGATLIYNGLEDTTVGIPQHGHQQPFFEDIQHRTARLRGSRQGIFETGFVPGVGHRPHFVTKPIASWLEKQLDFPKWTEETIRAMPETHIGEWARIHGVQLDPLYASEEREGGTPALGALIPAPSRQTLSVFSTEEWHKRKGRMIHESWLEQAKARMTSAASRQ
jgi:dienelactone hydrolase